LTVSLTPASPPDGYTNPESFTFDPKVIYDQYAQRFLVVTLEHIDNGPTDEQSRIYVAVSEDDDPTGDWYVTSIDTKISIDSNDHWADYPGFAVDEEAVYITNNMFSFNNGSFGGVRFWILDKDETDGFYAGGVADVTIHDPYAGVGSIATTTQPAHTFGTTPAGMGTFLVSYSGIYSGSNYDEVQVVRVDNPLGIPTFTQQFISVGDIEDVLALMPDAPQFGSDDKIETNDRRALNAVWRDATLWLATTILGSDTDDSQATAYWVALDTSTLSNITVADQGSIGGEDIANDTHTFFPSIAVNSRKDVVIGFSASGPGIYPGAYFTTRAVADPAGTTGPSQVVQAGTDYYYRAFGGSRNRWGDYSGTAVDPATECFWVYNEYAMSRGTVTSGGEDGRWGTAYSETCPCTSSYALEPDQWKMFSLGCNVGSADTVADLFGDDLVVGEYDSSWVVFRRNEANDSYEQMTLSDTLEEGRSCWIITTDIGKHVTIKGIHNDVIEVPLIAESINGLYNMVGHPFNSDVDWADVRVVDEASVLTLDEVDPEVAGIRACEETPARKDCIMSRVMHKWNGNSYDPYDGETLGMEGTLNPLDGLWVKAFKDDISLRVQASGGGAPLSVLQQDISPDFAEPGYFALEDSGNNISAETESSDQDGKPSPSGEGWFIRLIAESNQMRDAGNVLGQLPDSLNGYDKHDLKEMPPFDKDQYLTIVFPHEDWGKFSGDYASDYRALFNKSKGVWDFTVKASDDVKFVTLSFEGAASLLKQARLIVMDGDKRKKKSLRIGKNKKYRFRINGNSRSFKIKVKKHRRTLNNRGFEYSIYN